MAAWLLRTSPAAAALHQCFSHWMSGTVVQEGGLRSIGGWGGRDSEGLVCRPSRGRLGGGAGVCTVPDPASPVGPSGQHGGAPPPCLARYAGERDYEDLPGALEAAGHALKLLRPLMRWPLAAPRPPRELLRAGRGPRAHPAAVGHGLGTEGLAGRLEFRACPQRRRLSRELRGGE